MKVLLAGAFGNLGVDLLKVLTDNNIEVKAIDVIEKDVGFNKKFDFKKVNIENPEEIEGICDGCDVVISTVGLTKTQINLEKTFDEVDYQANLNLLNEAKKSKVEKFVFVSLLKCDQDNTIPKFKARYKFEHELYDCGLNYLVVRSAPYFSDLQEIAFSMLDSGAIRIVKGKEVFTSPISTFDLANFIVENLDKNNDILSVGGNEVYSYEQIANMIVDFSPTIVKIKKMSPSVYDFIINRARDDFNFYSYLKFSKWVMTEHTVADIRYGKDSLKNYLFDLFKDY